MPAGLVFIVAIFLILIHFSKPKCKKCGERASTSRVICFTITDENGQETKDHFCPKKCSHEYYVCQVCGEPSKYLDEKGTFCSKRCQKEYLNI